MIIRNFFLYINDLSLFSIYLQIRSLYKLKVYQLSLKMCCWSTCPNIHKMVNSLLKQKNNYNNFWQYITYENISCSTIYLAISDSCKKKWRNIFFNKNWIERTKLNIQYATKTYTMYLLDSLIQHIHTKSGDNLGGLQNFNSTIVFITNFNRITLFSFGKYTKKVIHSDWGKQYSNIILSIFKDKKHYLLLS